MTTLSREQRKALEKVSTKARLVAEEAAAKALRSLAVADREAHGSMTAEQAALRNRLRAHGRQLGDRRNVEKGTQQIDRLVSECAYEQWHRMLFAQFLAANDLLIEPVNEVSIPIAELREMARARGGDWVALAGEFAVRMLPQVFRQDDPVLQVQFAPEDRKYLEDLLESLPDEVFLASDSLGWCYQFWQAERKDEINESGDKIGADELPAVTQLFTEDYMVDFLLDNTLGAWHARKMLAADPELSETAQNEMELRQAVALPACPWNYLRFIKDKGGRWIPAAGTFDGWPKTAKELKCLDPCMGSGHFVIAMFERLVGLRLAEEELDETMAVAAVIRDNLFGLEIDPRCTQIGAFNLAMAAWRRVGYRSLPAMNLACSGLAPNAREADWVAVAGDDHKLQNGMARLYRLFKDAPVLGSLINPLTIEGDLLESGFHELRPLLEEALARETKDDTAHEIAVTARGVANAAAILGAKFTLVATNVPFLGSSRQDAALAEHLDRHFKQARADLATAMIYRMRDMTAISCSIVFVSPQTWMFLRNYKAFRFDVLQHSAFNCIAALGARAFETITGEVVNVVLSVLTNARPAKASQFLAIDANAEEDVPRKRSALSSSALLQITQEEQVANPDHTIVLSNGLNLPRLSEYATSWQGLVTGDTAHFVMRFWEIVGPTDLWEFYISSPSIATDYCGRDSVIRWEKAGGALHRDSGAHNFPPASVLGQKGVLLSQGKTARATLYTGEVFNDGSVPVIPKRKGDLGALYAFLSQDNYTAEVRKINQKLIIGCGYFIKVPFDLAHWQKVASSKFPNGLPKPFSSDPTQWLFNGHPAGADQPLHVAVGRLLGYLWPRQTGSGFPDSPALGPDGLDELGDEDGIVAVSPAKGEAPAAERLSELLTHAYGKGWSARQQEEMLAQVGFSGKSLEHWLRNGFFEQHCALFHHRPFIWSIWDGLPDGFHALVNYHKLTAPNGTGRQTLEKLTFSYLGDWINRQKAERNTSAEGADGRLAAAVHLQEQLKKILAAEPPYDIFVRWKPLHEQALTWEPDINDGVRMNIRAFMKAKTLGGRSIFRKAPNIKWEKDRGKELERPKRDFPWLWGWDEETENFKGDRAFDGNRWNDLHYSNQTKRDAREAHNGKRR